MTIDDRVGLECAHCGCVAIWSNDNGMFRDGDGGECINCGWPGCVSCDLENPPEWIDHGDSYSMCNLVDCQDCAETMDYHDAAYRKVVPK